MVAAVQTRHPGPSTACKAGAQDKLQPKAEGRDPARQAQGSLDSGLRRSDEIWRVLEAVLDPEIPIVSIVDLGIVRDVSADRVLLTPTYTGCPATLVIETMVRAALDEAGFGDVAIETTLSPPWTTDWITESGKAKLKAYGIAPPTPAGTHAVECPQCGSTATEEISRFGSTPCKAQWRCRDCLEPFDLFKCH
ncbi:1,2-phenylacetyl-CoA epoxidase subunit PaaD [Sphingosinicella sp. LHD-64]|uniref:1,2-phenylacetyl-CoA epoxidase subunit PaaD n=1 Tax=Sphingosinicella sp. LHD-64 TaxID=3072139 RepID=UPI00280D655E|nr:1,2-phenylacetyl-CoA epoxidase subunit PaaD [Sphingosinicella sp. LHD-64]MDQ8754908.1 1,2-phenylacetyl-CoA epoxidase subunit PaaD [Sphingosinicella sp. LHD-64]